MILCLFLLCQNPSKRISMFVISYLFISLCNKVYFVFLNLAIQNYDKTTNKEWDIPVKYFLMTLSVSTSCSCSSSETSFGSKYISFVNVPPISILNHGIAAKKETTM